MSASTPTRRRHVAICPFPFTSHPGTMLLLARKISASTPDTHISLFTTNPSAATLSSSLSSQESVNIRVVRVDDGLKGAAEVTFVEVLRTFVEVAGESLRKGMAAAEEEVGVKIGCIVADAMLAYACRDIAEERGVKWVALWSPSSASLVTHLYTDQLRNAVAPEGIEAHKGEALTVDKYIPGFPPGIPLEDLPQEILGVDYAFPVARILHLMSLHLPKATAVAVNSFHPLEFAETNILGRILGDNKLLEAGPFNLTLSTASSSSHIVDPNGCLAWLDTHTAASVVYISFGTGSMPPPEELGFLVEALEAARVPFLWSLPDRFKSTLPEGFIRRVINIGKVVSWAPQTSVLSHVATGAHMTHCGWNSLLESIVAGVPMICMPTKMADQKFNARRAVAGSDVDGWGIGVAVEGGRLTKAVLDRVMLGEEGRRMREKIGAMKKLAKEASNEPDGSSVRNLHKFIGIITS